MPYRFIKFLDNIEEVIPSNYIHTFLIRDPHRTMPSFYKGLEDEGRSKTARPGVYYLSILRDIREGVFYRWDILHPIFQFHNKLFPIHVSRKLQYKDVYRRTIEMPQCARTFQVNCCLKVQCTHKTTITSFGIRTSC